MAELKAAYGIPPESGVFFLPGTRSFSIWGDMVRLDKETLDQLLEGFREDMVKLDNETLDQILEGLLQEGSLKEN